jgi:putative transposase
MKSAEQAAPRLGINLALLALGLSVATYYRHRHATREKKTKHRPQRALAPVETKAALAALHEPRFVDRAPAEVYATLLDEGTYLCSERTMYRILAANKEVRERRNQLRHPKYVKPQLVATDPNQVWSWDITKLLTHTKWYYLYLYVIMDLYSRYVVGWMVAEHENATLASMLIDETYRKHDIVPGQLVLHSDRGSPMKAKTLSQLLSHLDVTRSLNRPHVSNDNPFSESHFRTLKYHPDFPKRFTGIDHGLEHCRGWFPWYNDHHRHSGIAYLTPSDVHFGRAEQILQQRHQIMLRAYREHPERFPRGAPRPLSLPSAVWINPPDATDHARPIGACDKPRATKSTVMATGEAEPLVSPSGSPASAGDPDGHRPLHGAQVAPQHCPILRAGEHSTATQDPPLATPVEQGSATTKEESQ